MNLITNRMLLRPFIQEDLNDLHKIMSNKKVASLAGFKIKNNLFEINSILDCFLKEPENNLWAIQLNDTNNLIGWIELHSPIENLYTNSKEIGFVLSENYWGQGLMPEVISCITNYAFNELTIDSLICSHFKKNIQSKKAIEKCNFKYDSEFHNKYYYILKN
ncbi:MAG: GNAT family N-acetyltransferase [Sarcina sp.]